MSKHIIHKLFSHGAESGASSLVINNSKDGLFFDYKFPDGSEQNFSLPQKLGLKIFNSLYQILKISPDDFKTDQNFKLIEKNYELKFKLNLISSKDSDKIIIQINKQTNKNWRLKQLGHQKDNLKILQKIKKIKSGLVIISSPEDNGKSATLLAVLNEFDTESINAYSFEKNPKQTIPGINYLAASAGNWDKFLNHDSNLIIFDNLKDNLDWLNAIKAANTGRLVIATTVANSSFEVILKILKLDLPLAMKINNLKIITNQRLVNLARSRKKEKKFNLFENRTKIAVSEVVDFNQKIKKYLLENGADYQKEKFWRKLHNLMIENGFKALNYDLAQKINNGSVKK